MIPPWDSAFIFLLCCTEDYVLAHLEDLDEFAWNNVKDKFASLNLQRSLLYISDGWVLVVW
jgi:hypothetical protein